MADNEPQQVSAPAPGAPEGAADGGSERPRLQLKPRSANAGAPAAIAKSNKSNPFGAARPREEILKSKGIDVAKVEKELDERTRRLPRMNKQQQEEYDAAEAEIAFAKSELEKAESDEAKAAAEEELKQKQNSVNELIESFRAVEIKPRRAAAADSSETGAPEANSRPTFIRPSERRARREERNMQQGFDSYNNNSQGGQSGDFSSFGRRGFGGDRTCYNCGQAGHISRDCPDGNSGGGGGGFSGGRGFGGEGGGGGGRTCYNCGQPGHISRDCPDGNSGGGGYSGGGNSGGFGGGFGGAFGGGNSRGGFGGGDRTCYNCGQPGHISRDCPDRQGGYGGSSDNYGGGGF